MVRWFLAAYGTPGAHVSVTIGYYQAVVAILPAIGVIVLVASGTRRSVQAAC